MHWCEIQFEAKNCKPVVTLIFQQQDMSRKRSAISQKGAESQIARVVNLRRSWPMVFINPHTILIVHQELKNLKTEDIPQAMQTLFGSLVCYAPAFSQSGKELGKLYWSDATHKAPANNVASQLLQDKRKIKGIAILVGTSPSKQSKVAPSLTVEDIHNLQNMQNVEHGEAARPFIAVRNTGGTMPTKPKTAKSFYVLEMKSKLEKSETLNMDELEQKWKEIDQTPYLELAKEDDERYEKEQKAHKAAFPPQFAPPTQVRAAYAFFQNVHKSEEWKDRKWASLTAEEKQPFEVKHDEDRVRYNAEYAEYLQRCIDARPKKAKVDKEVDNEPQVKTEQSADDSSTDESTDDDAE